MQAEHVVRLEEMTVSMLSGDEIIAVDPTTTLDDVAGTLVREGVGAVLVGSTRHPVGIVSERDIVHALADGLDPTTTVASDVAHTSLVTVDAHSSIDDAANLMMDEWVRHVLVKDRSRLVGVLSARDLLGVYCSSVEAEVPEL